MKAREIRRISPESAGDELPARGGGDLRSSHKVSTNGDLWVRGAKSPKWSPPAPRDTEGLTPVLTGRGSAVSRSGSCHAQPPATAPTLDGNLGVTAGCWDQDGSPVLQHEAAAPAKAAAHGPAPAKFQRGLHRRVSPARQKAALAWPCQRIHQQPQESSILINKGIAAAAWI